jgi:hypothetical protein
MAARRATTRETDIHARGETLAASSRVAARP